MVDISCQGSIFNRIWLCIFRERGLSFYCSKFFISHSIGHNKITGYNRYFFECLFKFVLFDDFGLQEKSAQLTKYFFLGFNKKLVRSVERFQLFVANFGNAQTAQRGSWFSSKSVGSGRSHIVSPTLRSRAFSITRRDQMWFLKLPCRALQGPRGPSCLAATATPRGPRTPVSFSCLWMASLGLTNENCTKWYQYGSPK